MVNQNIINRFREKNNLDVIYICQLLGENNITIYNINQSSKPITSNGILYRPFPFKVEADAYSVGEDFSMRLTFPNFTKNEINRQRVKEVKKARVGFIATDFPDEPIIPLNILLFQSHTISAGTISYTLAPPQIQNKRFPYRNFNSVDHPELYEIYSNEV